MTKQELDKIITANYEYIINKVHSIAAVSPLTYVKNNNVDDVISELYIILSKPRMLNKMRNEKDVRGNVNNILVTLLRKSGSKYYRDCLNIKANVRFTDVDLQFDIYNEEDNTGHFTEEYYNAVDEYLTNGKESDKRLYNLYTIRGINTYSKLSDHLQISRHGAAELVFEMKGIIENIASGMDYEEASEVYQLQRKELNKIKNNNKKNK